MNSDIRNELHVLALKISKPFCYSCYNIALNGVCRRCGSDDLMRLIEDVSCDYGTEWIIQYILKKELKNVKIEHPVVDNKDNLISFDHGITYYKKDEITALLLKPLNSYSSSNSSS